MFQPSFKAFLDHTNDSIFQARNISTLELDPDDSDELPSDVCILVRVFNVSTDPNVKPNVSFLMDPWDMHLAGQLQLKVIGGYKGQVKV
jgi:hypothetical protein